MAVLAQGVLLRYEAMTYQRTHIIGETLLVEGLVVIFLDLLHLHLEFPPVSARTPKLDRLGFSSREILHLWRSPI